MGLSVMACPFDGLLVLPDSTGSLGEGFTVGENVGPNVDVDGSFEGTFDSS